MNRRFIIVLVLLILSIILNLALLISRPKQKAPEPSIKTEEVAEVKESVDADAIEAAKLQCQQDAQRQSIVELTFLRKLATDEGAVNMAGAIDRLLANRERRLEGMTGTTMDRRPGGAADRARGRKQLEDMIRKRQMDRKMLTPPAPNNSDTNK